jgi:WhiB family redox-sensing transcriptional regulator
MPEASRQFTDMPENSAAQAEFVRSQISQGESWFNFANCKGYNPDIFYSDSKPVIRFAKSICASCDVAPDCLDYALTHPETLGIWGGNTERERRSLIKNRLRNIHTPSRIGATSLSDVSTRAVRNSQNLL